MFLLNRSLSAPWVHLPTLGLALGLGLGLGLAGVGCTSKPNLETGDSSEKQESSSKGGSGAKSAMKGSSSPSSSSKMGSKTGSKTGGGKGSERDCDKIAWASGSEIIPSVGAILPRDDQTGFVDSNGDGVSEDKPTQAGMCALHKTGAKCALVTYGFNG